MSRPRRPGRFDEKLHDAELSLQEMRERAHGGDNRPFLKSFRDFLASARTVVQYVNDESEARLRGATYEALTRNPVFGYFRDLRDQDIHRHPAGVTAVITACKKLTIHWEPGSRPGLPGQTPAPKLIGISGAEEWRLTKAVDRDGKEVEWPGPGRGEVFEACTLYLAAIRKLLDDAAAAGCIALP